MPRICRQEVREGQVIQRQFVRKKSRASALLFFFGARLEIRGSAGLRRYEKVRIAAVQYRIFPATPRVIMPCRRENVSWLSCQAELIRRSQRCPAPRIRACCGGTGGRRLARSGPSQRRFGLSRFAGNAPDRACSRQCGSRRDRGRLPDLGKRDRNAPFWRQRLMRSGRAARRLLSGAVRSGRRPTQIRRSLSALALSGVGHDHLNGDLSDC